MEDDKVISKELKEYIEKWDYNVKIAKDFKNIMECFYSYKPDLILLDISLPFYNGYYWCEEIRKVSTIPIIFISSAKDTMNQIMAMTMGGDDFIEKPFDLELLMAKITALMRRTYDFTTNPEILEHKNILLNLMDNTIMYNDKITKLSKNEYKILYILMKNAGTIISREDIMLSLWETDSYIDDNTLTVNISRTREKLKEIRVENFIQTKVGIGYIIE